MDVILAPELQEYVTSQVESGEFDSQSDVIRDALEKKIIRSLEPEIERRLKTIDDIPENELTEADDAFFDAEIARINMKLK